MPGGLQGGEVGIAVEHLAGGLDPVVEEGRLELRHDGAFDAVMVVAPLARRVAVALPLVGNADAADEADPAVHHHDLSMRAVVDQEPGCGIVNVEGVILMHLASGVAQPLEVRAIDLVASDRVNQQVNFHPGPRTVAEGGGESIADRTFPVDIGLKGNGLLRPAMADSIAGKISSPLRSVWTEFPVSKRRPQQATGHPSELRIGHRVVGSEVIPNRPLHRAAGHNKGQGCVETDKSNPPRQRRGARDK